MVNSCTFVGTIGRDAESRKVGENTVSEVSIACTEKYKDKETTEWVNITIWGKEGLIKHLTKGRKIYVNGKMQTQSWEKDGEKKYKTIINAFNVQIVDWGKDKKEDGLRASSTTAKTQEFAPEKDDLPF